MEYSSCGPNKTHLELETTTPPKIKLSATAEALKAIVNWSNVTIMEHLTAVTWIVLYLEVLL